MSHPNDNENANITLLAGALISFFIVGIIAFVVIPSITDSMASQIPESSPFSASMQDTVSIMQTATKFLVIIPILVITSLVLSMLGSNSSRGESSQLLSPSHYTPVTPMQPNVSIHSNVITDNTQEILSTPTHAPAQQPASLADHYQETTHQLTRWETLDLVSDSDK